MGDSILGHTRVRIEVMLMLLLMLIMMTLVMMTLVIMTMVMVVLLQLWCTDEEVAGWSKEL